MKRGKAKVNTKDRGSLIISNKFLLVKIIILESDFFI